MGEGMEGITGAEATGRGSSVCAGLLGGPTRWPELVLEGRLKLMDNGLETVATIKIFVLFRFAGRNVRKMNFMFNLKVTVFSATH